MAFSRRGDERDGGAQVVSQSSSAEPRNGAYAGLIRDVMAVGRLGDDRDRGAQVYHTCGRQVF